MEEQERMSADINPFKAFAPKSKIPYEEDSKGPSIGLNTREEETSFSGVMPTTRNRSTQEDDSTGYSDLLYESEKKMPRMAHMSNELNDPTGYTEPLGEEYNPFTENFLYANKENISSSESPQLSLPDPLRKNPIKPSSPEIVYAQIINDILQARYGCQLNAKTTLEANREKEKQDRNKSQKQLDALVKKVKQAEKWDYYTTMTSNGLKALQLVGGSAVIAAGLTSPGISAAAISNLTWAGGEMIAGAAAQLLAYFLKRQGKASEYLDYLDGAGKALSLWGAGKSLSHLSLFIKQIPRTLELSAAATPEIVNAKKVAVNNEKLKTLAEMNKVRVKQEKETIEAQDASRRDLAEFSLKSVMGIASRLSDQAHVVSQTILRMLRKV